MNTSLIKIPLVLSTLAMAAAAATAGAGCCGGDKTADPNTKQPEAKKAEIICPVMNRKIASAEKATGKSVYQGTTYYFCCKPCKTQFDKNPAKYVKKTASPKTPDAGHGQHHGG